MESEFKKLNQELDEFIDILLFFNKNFEKFQNFSVNNNKLYLYYLKRKQKIFSIKRERILNK